VKTAYLVQPFTRLDSILREDRLMSQTATPTFAGETFGRFVIATTWDDVPAKIRHEGKRSLLNFIGCAMGSAADPAIETAVGVLRTFAGGPAATVIGRPERMDALNASFLNAVSANLLDFDDTHLRTVIHPTAPVAPPVLALAEQQGSSGADVLLAFLLGAEVECRLGNSVPGAYARGWHVTTTCGVFGAAAAASRLLKLSPQQTWHALGIAASQAAGIVENLANAAKNVSVGNSARNGLLAALFAQQGYAAAPAAIEGRNGWARASGDEASMQELGGELGSRWEIGRNTYKPYPCGIVMHSIIDACLALRQEHKIGAADITSVLVRGSPLLLERGDRVVRNERDARVSIHHSVAAPFLWGAAGIREFAEAQAMHADAIALREKVRAEVDAKMPNGAAQVIVRTAAGKELERTVINARGSFENPLTDAEIESKVRTLAGSNPAGRNIDKVIAAVWDLDHAPDIGGIVRDLAAPA
jgi:2-methylcitrate dehydratase PrpD